MMVIRKFLDCSVLHLPPAEQREIMDNGQSASFSAWCSVGNGAFVYVSEPDVLADRSASVRRLFDYARERDCDYILFDRDAETFEGFEVFRPYCDECGDKGCEHCNEAPEGWAYAETSVNE